MKENILQAKRMGSDNETLYDVKNHRIRVEFIDKNDEKVSIDFSAWNRPLKVKKGYRYSKKISIFFDATKEVIEKDGYRSYSSRYPVLDNFSKLSYTKKNILDVVNFYSKVHYDKLNIISR